MSAPETSPRPIPIFVLAGALGSGKTTLMTKLARYCLDNQHRVGMVVNDFSDLGVDALILAEAGWPDAAVDAMNGACACCSDDSDLGAVLSGMIELNREVLLFETTGVADPADMLSQLTVRELRSLIEVPRMVTLLDLTRFPDPAGERPRVKRQIALADLIVLTRLDLVDADCVSAARAAIRLENPSVPIVDHEIDDADLAGLLRLDASHDRGLDALLADGLLPHEHPHTLSVTLPNVLSDERFRAFLSRLPPTILRAKGFVALDVDSSLHVFQFVEPSSVSLKPFSFTPRDGLAIATGPESPFGVFIGSAIDVDQLRAELDACKV